MTTVTEPPSSAPAASRRCSNTTRSARSRTPTPAGTRTIPRIALVAGADTDGEHLSAFGDDWGIPRDHLFADYRTMLERIRPDIVSVVRLRA